MNRFLLIAQCGFLLACGQQQNDPSPTNGPLVVFASEDYSRLADTLAKEFQRIYPDVTPTVVAMSTREAIVHFVNDSVSTILIDRPFNAEERRVLAEAEKATAATTIAADALVAVVHADHRIDSISVGSIKAILTGTAIRWSRVPESRRSDEVKFVTTGKNSGLHERLQWWFVPEGTEIRGSAVERTQEECIAYVGRTPGSMTVVSLSSVQHRPSTVKILPVVTLVDSVAGRYAGVEPSQTTVFSGAYPLRFQILLYNGERRPATGSGFAAFLLITPGQKIIQNTGLVPAEPPNRVIQLTSE